MIGNGPDLPAPGPLHRTALVTGGAGVLGHAVATQLARGGCRVAILDIGEGAEERAAALPGGIGFTCDVGDPAALGSAYAAVRAELGPPAVVVHCAGVAPIAPFLEVDVATFSEALDVNLTAGFTLYQLAARELVAAGLAGRFITIASISGARAGFGRTAYGTSKAAAIHLVKQIALELGPYGITANVVAPGPVDTPLSRGAHTAEMRADYVRTIPMARFGEAKEVANAVAYFASEDAAYVTGQTLFVDGGYMASGMGVTLAQSTAAVRRPKVRSSS
ncbi:SDR family NAD(P)-dependent oxidoreductase [Acuticoccus sp.]|uniref:SDR family NAD(P)-dependent oxidoreductase n=1 Tax=Acuticoccus sp. TaxID=1904378 RepID=UPI003B517B64